MLGNGASPDKRAAVFDLLPHGDKYRVVFDNGDHMVFNGGYTQESGLFMQFIGNDSPHTVAATTALIHKQLSLLTSKFLDAYLKDDADAKVWLVQSAAETLGRAGAWVTK